VNIDVIIDDWANRRELFFFVCSFLSVHEWVLCSVVAVVVAQYFRCWERQRERENTIPFHLFMFFHVVVHCGALLLLIVECNVAVLFFFTSCSYDT